jgi:hypothetical protein
MAEAMSGPVNHCPWCSAPLPDATVERCPSCDAVLTSATAEGDIRGVTTLDPEAILRARADVARPRNRILSFITGDVSADTGATSNPESLAPPPDEVRREMLRLQLEAERADLTAETVALKSDELVEMGIPLSQLGTDEPALEPSSAPAAEATAAGTPAAATAPPAATASPAAPAPPAAPAAPASEEPPAPA